MSNVISSEEIRAALADDQNKAYRTDLIDQREGETEQRYWQRVWFETRVQSLVQDAERIGFRVTIENKSDTPPAMRNYHPVIHVYESRK